MHGFAIFCSIIITILKVPSYLFRSLSYGCYIVLKNLSKTWNDIIFFCLIIQILFHILICYNFKISVNKEWHRHNNFNQIRFLPALYLITSAPFSFLHSMLNGINHQFNFVTISIQRSLSLDSLIMSNITRFPLKNVHRLLKSMELSLHQQFCSLKPIKKSSKNLRPKMLELYLTHWLNNLSVII
jgi:hypothetical protein